MVELDVRMTRDGVPVLSHDADLRRLTGCAVEIAGANAAGLAEIRRPDGSAGAPWLAELLSAVGPLRVLLDIKVDAVGALEAILEAVEAAALGLRVIYGVRSPDAANRLARLQPRAPRLALFDDADAYAPFLAAGGMAFRLWESDATRWRIRAIHRAGGEVWVTAGRPNNLARSVGDIDEIAVADLAARNVDAILVNDPARALNAFRASAVLGDRYA